MEVYIDNNKRVITEIKSFHLHFDLPKNVDNSLKHELDHIIKHNRFLAELRVKTRLSDYCLNITMNTKNNSFKVSFLLGLIEL